MSPGWWPDVPMSPDAEPPDSPERSPWRLAEHVRRVNQELRAGLEDAQEDAS